MRPFLLVLTAVVFWGCTGPSPHDFAVEASQAIPVVQGCEGLRAASIRNIEYVDDRRRGFLRETGRINVEMVELTATAWMRAMMLFDACDGHRQGRFTLEERNRLTSMIMAPEAYIATSYTSGQLGQLILRFDELDQYVRETRMDESEVSTGPEILQRELGNETGASLDVVLRAIVLSDSTREAREREREQVLAGAILRLDTLLSRSAGGNTPFTHGSEPPRQASSRLHMVDSLVITFGRARTDVSEADVSRIQRFIHSASGGDMFYNVVGSADPTGSASMNLRLSIERANSVARLMVLYGAPAFRVSAMGIGPTSRNRPVERNRAVTVYAFELR